MAKDEKKTQAPSAAAPADDAARAKRPPLLQALKRKAVQVGFRAVMTAILIFTVTGVGLANLSTSHRLLSENKLRDVWAILFLELERRAAELSIQLKNNTGALTDPPTVVTVNLDGRFTYVSGPKLAIAGLQNFGIERFEDLTSWNLMSEMAMTNPNKKLSEPSDPDDQVKRMYLLRPSPDVKLRRLTITRYRNKVRLTNARNVASTSFIYVASRQSRLVYSNSHEINQVGFLTRTLVQKFISLPAWQGQMDLTDEQGLPFYGFFHEVPGTNLIVFAETSKAAVTSAVTAATRGLLVTLILTIAGAILLLQVPLYFLLKPVRSLVKVAERVAAGDFDAKPEGFGMGEVRALAEAFGKMIGALKRRDDTINKLMREQVDKLRLENEIALARSIQDSLLPIEPISPASGLEIVARYQPAGEVAGDWYGYFHDEGRNASVVAIVDVSGHGAGASMFTAITASIFEEFRITFAAGCDPTVFFANLNRNLRRYGRGKWSATAQLVIYFKDRSTLEIINAGHPPTILSVLDAQDGAAPKPAGSPSFAALSKTSSNLLGLSEELTLANQTVPFPVGRAAVLYTDGLSERRDPAGKIFGVKRIATALGKAPRRAPEALLQGVFNAAEAHARQQVPDDDVCVVVLRSAA